MNYDAPCGCAACISAPPESNDASINTSHSQTLPLRAHRSSMKGRNGSHPVEIPPKENLYLYLQHC
eukprot:357833-Chlamydomonas_euryale.AAC.5